MAWREQAEEAPPSPLGLVSSGHVPGVAPMGHPKEEAEARILCHSCRCCPAARVPWLASPLRPGPPPSSWSQSRVSKPGMDLPLGQMGWPAAQGWRRKGLQWFLHTWGSERALRAVGSHVKTRHKEPGLGVGGRARTGPGESELLPG